MLNQAKIVLRFDKVDFFIPKTESNIAKLDCKDKKIAKYKYVINCKGETEIEYLDHIFSYNKQGIDYRYPFKEGNYLYEPLYCNDCLTCLLESFLRPYDKGHYPQISKHRHSNRIKRDYCVDDVATVETSYDPTHTNPYDAFRIRITNSRKNSHKSIRDEKAQWVDYHLVVWSIFDILDLLGIEYEFSIIEFAFDTIDPALGRILAENMCLIRARPKKLKNFENGYEEEGASSDGTEEYSALDKNKPIRLTHCYTKLDVCPPIFRYELKLKRKDLKKHKEIRTFDDLITGIDHIIESRLTYVEFYKKLLRKDIREAKDWHLDKKSILGKKAMLKENGVTSNDMRKYFDNKPFPWDKIINGIKIDPTEIREVTGDLDPPNNFKMNIRDILLKDSKAILSMVIFECLLKIEPVLFAIAVINFFKTLWNQYGYLKLAPFRRAFSPRYIP